jgi:replicative DNA helicase
MEWLSRNIQFDDFSDMEHKNKTRKKVPTGVKELDKILNGGLRVGLHCIGAVSALGKSTFCIQLMDSIAAQGQDVIFFSLEMPYADINAKSISRIMYEIDKTQAAPSDDLHESAIVAEWADDKKKVLNKALKKAAKLGEHSYVVQCNDKPISAKDIDVYIEDFVKNKQTQPFVIVDYLQILAKYNPKYTDKQDMDANIAELKRIAHKYEIPILLISSLNRASYLGQVELNSFKESGAIEYTAETVLGLQYQGAGSQGFDLKKASSKQVREVELTVLKHRYGPAGLVIPMEYIPEFNSFSIVKQRRSKKVY